MKTISVRTSPPYDILLGNGLAASVGALLKTRVQPCRVLLVSDDQIWPLYGKIIEASLNASGYTTDSFIFPHGETSKTPATLFALWEKAAGFITRSDLFLALGGGVTGDLTGFAAATLLRGVRYVSVPTSLLAMVDSSVGGKTAVDLPSGKNLAGAFHQPSLVVIDPVLLETLSPHFYADGMAEVIKYGFINRPVLLNLLEKDANIEEIISVCVDDKRIIVEQDAHDHGLRQLLNFGHTPAHAIEWLSDYTVSHGFAVAAGMSIITRASVREGYCPPQILARLLALLQKYKLPQTCEYDSESLAREALQDKKRSGDKISLVLPTESGCKLVPTDVNSLAAFFGKGIDSL